MRRVPAEDDPTSADVSHDPSVTTTQWPDPVWALELIASGWKAYPITQYVLKIVGRCNLACDYCYVYTGPDRSWSSRPPTMSDEVLDATINRIAAHAMDHGLAEVKVVLHGGEPLLAGPRRLDDIAGALRSGFASRTGVSLSIQTNGILLSEAMLKVLHHHQIRVGVSLDGDSASHDRHRRWADRRGSYDDTMAGLRLLCQPRHRDLFAGLLAVVDPDTPPIAVYEALLELGPPSVSLLLPHADWSTPPPARTADRATPYGDWLIAVFDRWYDSGHVETRLTLFEEIMSLLLGGKSGAEQVGLSPVTYVIVDTDGSLQQTDALKMARAGGPETGLNVFTDPIDAVLAHPAVMARQAGVAALAHECRGCHLLHGCGGGHYAHRYRAGDGHRHPSVYCVDMMKLVGHIRARLRTDIRRGAEWEHTG